MAFFMANNVIIKTVITAMEQVPNFKARRRVFRKKKVPPQNRWESHVRLVMVCPK